jgi:hypothetical protein
MIRGEDIMQVTVFHKDFETGAFVRVAVVNAPMDNEMDALEYVYRYTNNVDGSWSKKIGSDANDNVEVVGELPVVDGKTYGLRSSMMFDRFYVKGGSAYEVAMMGFDELPEMVDVA